MKVGDLVKYREDGRAQALRGSVGVLVRQWEPCRDASWAKWFVVFGSEMHPYTINSDRLDLINEA